MRRNFQRVAAAGMCWVAAGATALACPICFQVEDTQTINGVRAGVIVLMSVTVVVLTAVAAFSIRVWRNEKLNRSDA
jgi:hypothetical protein